jgi:Cu/Ag efflux pump CusA
MANRRNLLLVLINLPFALVGGVVIAFVTGTTLSVGSLVGFVTIFGITLRNSMLILSHYEHLVSVEGETWGADTAVRGTSERLAPILMTALVTALAILWRLPVGHRATRSKAHGDRHSRRSRDLHSSQSPDDANPGTPLRPI